MGNQQGKESEPKKGKYDVEKIYWDGNGNLRHGRSLRNRDEELIKILQSDTKDEEDMTKVWMIIPSRWIRDWLIFVHYKMGDEPRRIDMLSLLKQDRDAPGGWRPKKTLLPPSTKFGEERPGHYRRISFDAWIKFVELYGVDGYAIAVRGYPYDDTSRWRVFKDPRKIDVTLLPEPQLPEEEKPAEKDKSTITSMAKSIGGLFKTSSKA